VNVLAAPLSDGWKFNGAGVCTNGDVRVAHLLYQRNKQFLSIFSMPAPESCHGRDAACAGKDVEKHPMSCFSRSNGLYALVGSSPDGSLSLQEVERIGQMLAPNLPGEAGCEPAAPVVAVVPAKSR
jgi:hypothetical protein